MADNNSIRERTGDFWKRKYEEKKAKCHHLEQLNAQLKQDVSVMKLELTAARDDKLRYQHAGEVLDTQLYRKRDEIEHVLREIADLTGGEATAADPCVPIRLRFLKALGSQARTTPAIAYGPSSSQHMTDPLSNGIQWHNTVPSNDTAYTDPPSPNMPQLTENDSPPDLPPPIPSYDEDEILRFTTPAERQAAQYSQEYEGGDDDGPPALERYGDTDEEEEYENHDYQSRGSRGRSEIAAHTAASSVPTGDSYAPGGEDPENPVPSTSAATAAVPTPTRKRKASTSSTRKSLTKKAPQKTTKKAPASGKGKKAPAKATVEKAAPKKKGTVAKKAAPKTPTLAAKKKSLPTSSKKSKADTSTTADSAQNRINLFKEVKDNPALVIWEGTEYENFEKAIYHGFTVYRCTVCDPHVVLQAKVAHSHCRKHRLAAGMYHQSMLYFSNQLIHFRQEGIRVPSH